MSSRKLAPALLVGLLALGILDPSAAYAADVDVSAAENVKPALPNIPERRFVLTDFGAIGDGHTLNTAAFKNAVAAIKKSGGGKLVVPVGTFRTLPFTLCSNLELHLESGAMIQAPASFAEYGLPDPTTFHSQEEVRDKVHAPEPLITGRNLHDVAITGSGRIDGNGALWWAWSERAARNAAKTQPGRIVYRRMHLIMLNECDRVLVADVTLTNSPMFHLVPRRIHDLTIERVKVHTPYELPQLDFIDAPNTDAIDPGPVTNCLIRDCDIDTGDDDIVLKSGGTNVLIENNTIKHGHGISIGSETTTGIHTMLVRHCTFDGTDNGIRIKSMRGAGGPVENVRYTDIQMKNVRDAIVLDLNYVDNNRPDFKGDAAKIPSIKNVLIDRVTVESARHAGRIVGLPESPITNVTLRDVMITAENDLVIKDAADPVFERVTRIIKPGVMPPAPESAKGE